MELRIETAINSGDVYGVDFEGCNIDIELIKNHGCEGVAQEKIVQKTWHWDSLSEPQKEMDEQKNLKISNSNTPWISLSISIT